MSADQHISDGTVERSVERSIESTAESTGSSRRHNPWTRLPRWLRWVLVLLVVIGLVILAAARVQSAVGAQAPGDPRSAAPTGAAAIAAILEGQGVQIDRVQSADDALATIARNKAENTTENNTGTTLLIVHPDRLDADQAMRIRRSGAARVILVAPNDTALRTFDTGVQLGGLPTAETLAPGCSDELTQRAGAIAVDPDADGLVPAAAAVGCYRDSSGAVRYLRVSTSTTEGEAGAGIDLVADGFANRRLASEGNAAFAAGLLGSQPRLVWLMTPEPVSSEPGGPTLLPSWWLILLAQVGLGVVVLAVWRGRRLGPIMVEPLPVVVRASETVEGHGRLYQRIQARDRAAAALREGARTRLSVRFGHGSDPHLLAETLAVRTGQDVGRISRLLAGPAPTTDSELNELARDLDQLEQEARQL